MAKHNEMFYSEVANQFDKLMNQYDLEQRLKIVFRNLLPEDISGKLLLDAGCGNGWFSRAAQQRGAIVYSLDISYAMLRQGQRFYSGQFINASASELPFENDKFDIVLSSEMIEHTHEPARTISDLARVIKPGGLLILTTPNRVWQWLVDFGSWIGARPFYGIENFISFSDLAKYLAVNNLAVESHFGFHPWPFQIRFLQPLSEKIDDRFGQSLWGQLMINQAVRAIKSFKEI